MHLEQLPDAAAWQHVDARTGFEVLFDAHWFVDYPGIAERRW